MDLLDIADVRSLRRANILLLVNRNIDMATVLKHPSNYQSMAKDLIGVDQIYKFEETDSNDSNPQTVTTVNAGASSSSSSPISNLLHLVSNPKGSTNSAVIPPILPPRKKKTIIVKLNDADEFWMKYRTAHITECMKAVQEKTLELNAFKDKVSQLLSLHGHQLLSTGHVRLSSGTNTDSSAKTDLTDLQAVMSSIPKFNADKTRN